MLLCRFLLLCLLIQLYRFLLLRRFLLMGRLFILHGFLCCVTSSPASIPLLCCFLKLLAPSCCIACSSLLHRLLLSCIFSYTVLSSIVSLPLHASCSCLLMGRFLLLCCLLCIIVFSNCHPVLSPSMSLYAVMLVSIYLVSFNFMLFS